MDYLNKINDIDYIYDLGVRSVNVVWNNKNKFGGGSKSNKEIGLTSLGKELVEKLVKKNIAIDLSHTNEKTFYNIVQECIKLKKYNPIVFASHSNCKNICNVSRNLSYNQIMKIKELNGTIGIVGIKQFCIDSTNKYSKEKYIKAYIDNINYLKSLGMLDNIALATDNMEYYITNQNYYKNMMIFAQNTVKEDICLALKREKYTDVEIQKITHINFENKILQSL